MKGRVADNHIFIDVVFVLPDRQNVSLEMVVDTGYVGTLTLPTAVIQRIHLPFLRNLSATLADGSSIDVDVYLATVIWHGIEQSTELICLDDRPLLGMLMLDGSQMRVDFENGGLMDLTELG